MDNLISTKQNQFIIALIVFFVLTIYKRGYTSLNINWFVRTIFKFLAFMFVVYLLGYELETAKMMALVYLLSLEFMRKRKRENFEDTNKDDKCEPIDSNTVLEFPEVNKALLIISTSISMDKECMKSDPVLIYFKNKTHVKDLSNKKEDELLIPTQISNLSKTSREKDVKTKLKLIVAKGNKLILTENNGNVQVFESSASEDKIYSDSGMLLNKFMNAVKIQIQLL